LWPESVSCGVSPNVSIDEHHSERAAKHVCGQLERFGLGREGKVFPISTRVEPIDPNYEEPKKSLFDIPYPYRTR